MTFFRKKAGHVLYPGRQICGEIHVADIGIPDSVLHGPMPQPNTLTCSIPSLSVHTFENSPAVWRHFIPYPTVTDHKYVRGHTLIVSGPAHATGAARLAARGALRIGAGLVSVASPPDAVAVNASHLTGIMIKPFDGPDGLAAILSDRRVNAVVVGPGVGVGPKTKALVAACLTDGARAVLDADALTSFFDEADALFGLLNRSEAVLTPHEGEFERLFPGLLAASPTRLAAAREAAARSHCTLVLKGPDTVIASADGRAAINTNAPPTLATAGSGDVLAGFIAGLWSQWAHPAWAMGSFEVACAAVWLHGECANCFGPGLIAEDLPEMLPAVLKGLRSASKIEHKS